MNYTADREEFADKQSKVQAKDERYLLGSARAALRRHAKGDKDWYEPLLKRVDQVARTAYRREAEGISSDTLRAALNKMRSELVESLDKTKKPEPGELEQRAKALAASLAAYANAVGVEAAAEFSDEEIGLEWVTMHDERVRDAHRAADGQVRLPGQKYDVGGVEMSRPGDVTAPIELWINCRCALRPAPYVRPEAIVAAAGEYEAHGVGIFLIPAADDPIHELTSEQAHVTMVWLGMDDEIEMPLDDIHNDVVQFAKDFKPVAVSVMETGELGDEGAEVAFLNRDELLDLRQGLLNHETITRQMESVEQFPDWMPHLTLGYPETPAPEGDLPSTIRFDRVALWVGTTQHEYPLGGDMAETDVVEEVEVEIDDDLGDMDPIDAAEAVPFYGVLAPEGVMSGDMRKFAPESMRWRDLPLPLMWQPSNEPGHDGAVMVGRIDNIWRDEAGLLQAEGEFLISEEADKVISQMAQGALRGVSVDVDDVSMSFEDQDGKELTMDSVLSEDTQVVTVVSSGRISAATMCAIPAFMEANLYLGLRPAPIEEPPADAVEDLDEEFRNISREDRDRMAKSGQALPDGSFPIANVEDLKNAIQAIGRAKDPAKAKAHIKKRAKALGEEGLIPDGWSAMIEAFVKTEDGPGWLTHPVDTDRLRDYWVRGKGAAKIRWGVPGDFNRCRAQVAKYVKPQHLAGYCANRHYDALGFWPGRPVAGETVDFTQGESFHLVASAGSTPSRPPREWFDNPNLSGPTRMTITEDGHIFGHLATWGTCHIGVAGVCITPPSSESNYAFFATGVTPTTEGEVETGVLTMNCGHAGPDASSRMAAAHYDNLGTGFANVVMGEDDIGIWFSGAVKSHITPEQIDMLRAAGSISGDWRDFGSSDLELVAALAVNVPGFPIPKTEIGASNGRQTALIASGIVLDRVRESIGDIVAKAIDDAFAKREAEKRMADLATHRAAQKMAALAATRGR